MERNGRIVKAAIATLVSIMGIFSMAAFIAPTASAAVVRFIPTASHVITTAGAYTVKGAQAARNLHAVRVASMYTVKTRDTLSGIAWSQCHGVVNDWTGIYKANRAKIGSNPNMIFPGMTFIIQCFDPPALLSLASPSAASTAASTSTGGDGDHDSDDPSTVQTGDNDGGAGNAPVGGHAVHQAPAPSGGSYSGGGTLSYAGLEALWMAAGGNPAYAATAACIAEHESGGNQYAHSPTDDYGYWQINGSHGALATYNAYGNARAAVIISSNGTDWSPWTTHYMCGV